jgi:hypothetical protein
MDGNSPSRTSSRLKRRQPRGTDQIYANIDVLQVDQAGHGGLPVRHKYQVSTYETKKPCFIRNFPFFKTLTEPFNLSSKNNLFN